MNSRFGIINPYYGEQSTVYAILNYTTSLPKMNKSTHSLEMTHYNALILLNQGPRDVTECLTTIPYEKVGLMTTLANFTPHFLYNNAELLVTPFSLRR
jgi:hypothetical protein